MVGNKARTSLALGLLCLALLLNAAPASASAGSRTTAAGLAQRSITSHAYALQTTSITLRPGMSGAAVRDLQERLVQLKYWLGAIDGEYGYLTTQAVMAFQKVNGLTRDGIAGPQTMAALQDPIRPQARSTGERVVEVKKGKQIAMLVRSGTVARIFNASTGTAETPTPSGRFQVYRQIDGWRESDLGLLYRPKYFIGGYAIHGSTSVPAYAASHGCVRVSLRAMDYLWSRVPIGTRVRIY
jgi:peptidoglycan hydrolase-like protein with peptidoglycan-binding domain